ncbi:MAG TPA: carbohydrate ABC transporter permease, partial [Lacisediminihabitans sp.]|uniref:carbohydrate ABC transporter permease n=1 Tax=Lacisediminihabitans sp. TaxID=2787631 RepID=UPI002EDBA7DF
MLTARTTMGRILLQLVLTLLVVPFLLPLIAMVQGSLAGEGWKNYTTVLGVPELPLFFRNSAIIALATIAIVYVFTMLAAFGFSKLHIRGKEVFFWMLLAALTLPGVVLLTPLFATTTTLNLYNTYWAVILPLAALQVPFTVLLARNFVNGIPDDLFDAARIDGAGTFQGFWYVILPLMKPIGAAIIVFTLIGAWNEYLFPLVFLVEPSTQTVTQLPQFFVGQFSNDQTKVLASA